MKDPFKDSDFLRDKDERGRIIPLTKKDIRLLTLAELNLSPSDRILDIGAGTGGLSCEAGRILEEGEVVAVEKKSEAAKLVVKNAKKLGLKNITVVNKSALDYFKDSRDIFEKIFIGGSSGKLPEIIECSVDHLSPDGRIVANFITLENAIKAKEELKKYFNDISLIQVFIASGEDIGGLTMMRSENPVIIVVAGDLKC